MRKISENIVMSVSVKVFAGVFHLFSASCPSGTGAGSLPFAAVSRVDLAFLFLAAYFTIPKSKNPINDIITEVRDEYSKDIEDATEARNKAEGKEATDAAQADLDNLHRDMNAEIESKVGGMKGVIFRSGSAELSKLTAKGFAFGFFVMAFILSTFPFAKPLGLLLAFIFYFSMKEGS